MSPLIKKGDILYVSPYQKRNLLRKFDIYIYTDQFGNKVVHRLIKKVGDNYLFKGDNNTHLDKLISINDVKYSIEKIERDSVTLEKSEFLFNILNLFSFIRSNSISVSTIFKLMLCKFSVKYKFFNSLLKKINLLIISILKVALNLLVHQSDLKVTRGRCLWKTYELLSDLDFILIAPKDEYVKVRKFIQVYIFLSRVYPLLGEVNFIPQEELEDFQKYGTYKQKASFTNKLVVKSEIDFFMIAVEVYGAFKSLTGQLRAFQAKENLNIKNKYEIIKNFIDLIRLDLSLKESLYITREDYIKGEYSLSIQAREIYKKILVLDKRDITNILNMINGLEFMTISLNMNDTKKTDKSYSSLNLLECLETKNMMVEDKEVVFVSLNAEIFLDKYSDLESLNVPLKERELVYKFYKTNYFTFFDLLKDKEKINVCVQELNQILTKNDKKSNFVKEILSHSNYNKLK